MKKLIFSLLLLSAFTIGTYAQEKQDDGTFKPSSGFTSEINFIPANTSMPISMNALKIRMFMSESMAIRFGFNFGMCNAKSKIPGDIGTTDPTEETQNSYLLFGLTPGIEMHMGDLPKLSPYVGAEIGINLKSSKGEITNYGNTGNSSFETKGCWTDGSNQGYFQIGFNLILGTDYYISQHLYTGVEIGFGFANRSNSEIKQTETVAGVAVTLTTPKNSAMNIGFNYNPAIRLGWAF